MSHFSVIVVINERIVPEAILDRVDQEMAPFMENCCAEPDKQYMKFYDEEDEYLKSYNEDSQEYVVMPYGRLLLPWDNEFKVKDPKDPLGFTTRSEPPAELERRMVPFKEKFSTFEEYVKEWHGRETRDETYNRYGYWQNGPKYLVEVCLGNEEQILQGMQNVEAAKVILSRKKGSGRWNYNLPVLPVPIMRQKGGEEESAARSSQAMALEGEVWDFLERISPTAEDTKRIMSDLFSSVKRTSNSTGPQSQNWGSESYIMRALQHTLGDGLRQYRGVTCGNKVPHKAHIIGTESFGGAKWDWYEIGGRWAGFFQLKKGRRGGKGKQYNFTGRMEATGDKADVCLKNAVDFEAMRQECEDEAIKRYDMVWKAIKDTPEAVSWEIMKAGYALRENRDDIDKCRKEYHDQPRVKAFQELCRSKEGSKMFGFFANVEDYQIPREEYIQKCRNGAAVPFAILKDGKWYESGQMGWWGMASNEKDPETWNSMVSKLMDDLPGEAILAAVDAHI